ncbi:hypothetical protein J7T55_002176 [Diaporthe amygdali]|uniref:uncharacterized protein n=1 Tax=Phomopsis amygdali TaxID=1214568 RepID=UPI0022FEF14A|nr:uncharacterized protein J7T55_002176 [Diaporthe amygdali]KAJ0103844.1 hypothetical protein J7T55_002176 [Diaporthe amygdali]
MDMFMLCFLTLVASMANTAFAVPAVLGGGFPSTTSGVVNSGVEGIIADPTLPPQKTGGMDYNPEDISRGPDLATFTVINKHTANISTSHQCGAGAPTAVSGFVGEGTMAPNASSAFAVPWNWTGNVAVIDAAYSLTGDVSLIEANYVQTWTSQVAVVDVDISYVNGFTLPIICSCDGKVVTGCIKDLFALGDCPKMDDQNACINPERGDNVTNTAATFFQPCQGEAYTFPNDHGANSYGECQSGSVTCCVGMACGLGK